MRWLTALITLACLTPMGAFAQGLTLYEAAPMVTDLHPFHLGTSTQGLHLSPLITERFGALDVESNTLRLTFLEAQTEGPATEFTLKIKEGMRWSDGEPVTSGDVVSSYKRLGAAAAQSGAPLAVKALRRSLFLLTDIRPAGEGAVVVRFASPVRSDELPALLAPLCLVPERVPDEALGDAGIPTAAPYSVTRRDDEILNLTANPNYHRGAPFIDNIEMLIADPDALSLALSDAGSGEVSLYIPLGFDALSPDLVLRQTEARRFAYLGFNLRPGSRLRTSPQLRQVIATLVDRRDLLQVVPTVDPEIEPIAGPYSPRTPLATGRAIPKASVAEAEAQLVELGYRRTGDNWRDGADRLLALRLVVHEDFPGGELSAKLVAEQLRRGGIRVEIETVSRQAFLELLASPRGDFDLILHEWMLDESEDITELYHSVGRYNYLGYQNPEVDIRLARERQAQLASSRRLYRSEIEEAFNSEPPAVFLWQRHDLIAIRGDVGGVPPLDPYYIFRDIHNWYIGTAPEPRDAATPTPAPTATPIPPAPTEAPPTPTPTPMPPGFTPAMTAPTPTPLPPTAAPGEMP